MRKVNNRFKGSIIWFIVLLWTVFSQIYWQLGPHIAEYNNQSLHTSAYLVIRGLTAIGPDILILLLGYFMSKKQNKESQIIKGWLNTLVFGIIISCLVAMSSNSLIKVTNFSANFFDSLFPIIRNTYPLIFGSLFGLLLVSIKEQLNASWQTRLKIGSWLLITIPFFNYPNIWGWSENYLVIFYGLLFLIGSFIRQKMRSIKLLGYGLLIFVINIGLQSFMPRFNNINGGGYVNPL